MNPKLILIVCLAITTCTNVPKDAEPPIIKVVYNLNYPDQAEKFDTWVRTNIVDLPNDTIAKRYESKKQDQFGNTAVYEDENFVVFGICGGEWGGGLHFVDKHKQRTYCFFCICPSMVDFRDGKYVITQNLTSYKLARITEIEDVRSLPLYPLKDLASAKAEEEKVHGTVLLDSFGLSFNLFYPHHGKNYLIYSKGDSTYLGEILNKKLVQKEILLNAGINVRGKQYNKIKNGFYIHDIESRQYVDETEGINDMKITSGAIYFKDGTIVIGYKSIFEYLKPFYDNDYLKNTHAPQHHDYPPPGDRSWLFAP